MASRGTVRADRPVERAEVAEAFAALPDAARDTLLQLRSLIFETAAETPGVGPLEEALRWGEPSCLTSESRSGTTIRIHWKPRRPDRCAMYVHCQANLVEQYRLREPLAFEFEGNRGVLFDIARPLPVGALRDCIRLALTYHQKQGRLYRRERPCCFEWRVFWLGLGETPRLPSRAKPTTQPGPPREETTACVDGDSRRFRERARLGRLRRLRSR
jgi:hypothetical protein